MSTNLITGVSGANSIDAYLENQPLPAKANVQAATEPPEDSVKLSPSEQMLASQLYEDGNSVQLIAETLHVSVSTLDSYLSIQHAAAMTNDGLSADGIGASVKA